MLLYCNYNSGIYLNSSPDISIQILLIQSLTLIVTLNNTDSVSPVIVCHFSTWSNH